MSTKTTLDANSSGTGWKPTPSFRSKHDTSENICSTSVQTVDFELRTKLCKMMDSWLHLFHKTKQKIHRSTLQCTQKIDDCKYIWRSLKHSRSLVPRHGMAVTKLSLMLHTNISFGL